MIDGIVLDVQLANAKSLGEPFAAYEWCKARMKSGPGLTLNWQQLAVAPQILRTFRNLLRRDSNCRVVVDRFEWTETTIADVRGQRREHRLAEMTLQAEKCGLGGIR
jgi:hypothetical protein